MKRVLSILFLLVSAITYSRAQEIKAYKAETLMQRVNNNDTIYVVNFWATWCGPCVQELPEFAKLEDHYKGQPVKILLVSLDFKEAVPKIPLFIKRKKLTSEVAWLNETNANKFIPKIDDRWQGSIPATLIVSGKHNYKNFFEGTISAKQIGLLIDKQLAMQ
ncbi:MAG: redoxin domain-containing protein [Sphingobacteriales bacterium]|nr:MAG: redoxin domain-containing protein [Sphingobacteriales bacterium]